MPIYLYKCHDCDHRFEALQKMSDPLLVDCPECGEASLQKQLTAAAFKLKGTGWYETDFKNSGKKPVEKKNAEGQNGGADSDKSTSSGDATKADKKTGDTGSNNSGSVTETASTAKVSSSSNATAGS